MASVAEAPSANAHALFWPSICGRDHRHRRRRRRDHAAGRWLRGRDGDERRERLTATGRSFDKGGGGSYAPRPASADTDPGTNRVRAGTRADGTGLHARGPAPAVSSPAKGVSLLGQGRTTLTDSIYAVRTGDSVLVNFDTQGNRTRRADKFEQMLRTTLPLVYGRRITSSLDSVPTGSLLPSRDIVGELTSQGVHLMLDNGLRISLWPQTRASADGPLVVAYRVVVER